MAVASLATSPSPPGGSSGRAAKPRAEGGARRAEGGEGLANIALDCVSLECQLHVPVTSEVPAGVKTTSVRLEASRLD